MGRPAYSFQLKNKQNMYYKLKISPYPPLLREGWVLHPPRLFKPPCLLETSESVFNMQLVEKLVEHQFFCH